MRQERTLVGEDWSASNKTDATRWGRLDLGAPPPAASEGGWDFMEPDDLLELMGARRGHVVYESGYHGDLWLDLDGMFAVPARLRAPLDDLAHRIAELRPDVVCGPLTGGALIAFAVATTLDVGLRWSYREQEPSGQGLFPYRYHLAATGAEVAGQRVVVVDDVINAGSATRETLRLLREQNATPVAIGALLALGEGPAALADHEGLDLVTLVNAANTLWTAERCPLCVAGTPTGPH